MPKHLNSLKTRKYIKFECCARNSQINIDNTVGLLAENNSISSPIEQAPNRHPEADYEEIMICTETRSFKTIVEERGGVLAING